MKKLLGLVLAGIMCASLFAACGSSGSTETTTASGSSEETTTASDSSEETTTASDSSEETTTSAASDVEEINSYLDVTPIEYKASDYVTLGDYSSFTVELDEDDYKVTDKTVKNYLNNIFDTYGYVGYNWTDKETTETGDTININLNFAIDGMDTENDSLEDTNIVLGDNYMQIDGFDEQLTGKNADEQTYNFTMTFPDDYAIEDYQGKTADFTVTINGVVEEYDMTYDKLTDTYVYDNFGYTTVDEYLADVKANLEDYYDSQRTTDIQIDVVDQLLASSTIKGIPEGLKQLRVNEYKNQYIYKANAAGITMDEYLSNNDLTEETWDEQVNTYMDDAVQKELIYMAIADEEGITTDSSDYTSYVAGMKDTLGMSENDFNKIYPEDYCKLLFKEQSVLDLLVERTTVKAK